MNNGLDPRVLDMMESSGLNPDKFIVSDYETLGKKHCVDIIYSYGANSGWSPLGNINHAFAEFLVEVEKSHYIQDNYKKYEMRIKELEEQLAATKLSQQDTDKRIERLCGIFEDRYEGSELLCHILRILKSPENTSDNEGSGASGYSKSGPLYIDEKGEIRPVRSIGQKKK